MVQKKNQQQQEQNKHESSLTRLSKIPVVEFTLYLSLSFYNKVKSSSELLNNVLNRVEKLAFSGFELVKPYANKYEKQINLVDSYGNSALDKFESAVPSVTKFQPKNAYASASNRVSSWTRYVAHNLNVLRSLNLSKSVTNGLKTVDNLVDQYMPGSEEEVNDESNDSVISQVVGIAGKLRKRSIKRVQNIQRLVY